MHRMHILVAGVALLLLATRAQAEMIDIDNDKLAALIAEGVPVIDVRRADEWQQTGIVADSQLKTFFDQSGRYDAQRWLADISEVIDPSEPFVLICHSGARSALIGKWLGKQFDTVYNHRKGISHWIADKRPVVTAPKDP